jgi:hypothetical protein
VSFLSPCQFNSLDKNRGHAVTLSIMGYEKGIPLENKRRLMKWNPMSLKRKYVKGDIWN